MKIRYKRNPDGGLLDDGERYLAFGYEFQGKHFEFHLGGKLEWGQVTEAEIPDELWDVVKHFREKIAEDWHTHLEIVEDLTK